MGSREGVVGVATKGGDTSYPYIYINSHVTLDSKGLWMAFSGL